MKTLLIVARVYVIFFGASGFLFGQLFFGQFSWAAMLAGVSGVVGGLLGQRIAVELRFLTIAVCATGIAGVAMDALHYYSELNTPGNYYAWIFIGPFAAALAFIGYLYARPAHTSADA